MIFKWLRQVIEITETSSITTVNGQMHLFPEVECGENGPLNIVGLHNKFCKHSRSDQVNVVTARPDYRYLNRLKLVARAMLISHQKTNLSR